MCIVHVFVANPWSVDNMKRGHKSKNIPKYGSHVGDTPQSLNPVINANKSDLMPINE